MKQTNVDCHGRFGAVNPEGMRENAVAYVEGSIDSVARKLKLDGREIEEMLAIAGDGGVREISREELKEKTRDFGFAENCDILIASLNEKGLVHVTDNGIWLDRRTWGYLGR